MSKYQREARLVINCEAKQVTLDNLTKISDWLNDNGYNVDITKSKPNHNIELQIYREDDLKKAYIGDWVVVELMTVAIFSDKKFKKKYTHVDE
jgi:hypothetical protein